MATAAEFWQCVQASGLTAEQELIQFWQRMKDCPCAGKKDLKPRGSSSDDNYSVIPRIRKRIEEEEALLLFVM